MALLVSAEPVLATTAESRFWEARKIATAPKPTLAMLPAALPSFAAPAPAGIDAALRTCPGRATKNSAATDLAPLILIEDVHLNSEAQKNIGETIRRLTATGKVGFVALEGASGNIDLSIRNRGVEATTLRNAADFLLEKGRISGAVHALLTTAGPEPRVTGVEVPALYAANTRALVEARAHLQSAEKSLVDLKVSLDRREKSGLNPELRALVDELSNSGEIKGLTAARVRLLCEMSQRAGQKPGPMLIRFNQAADLEKKFNSDGVDGDRRALMELLLPKMTDAERSLLMERAVSFRSGRISQSLLFREITAIAARHGLEIDHWPALAAHIRYLDVVDGIDANALTAESRDLENNLLAAAARTDSERDLLLARRWLVHANGLVRLALTSDDWREYVATDRKRVAAAIGTADLPNLEAFEYFYRLASLRDQALASRIEKLFETEKGTGVLVAGAFHADGLQRAVRASGRRMIRFTPRLTKVEDNRDAYFSAFTREKTPLDALFSGERLFLASPPAQLSLLPEMILLAEEAQDPSTPLQNPGRRLATLRGEPWTVPVATRDVGLNQSEAETFGNRLSASFRDGRWVDLKFEYVHLSVVESIRIRVRALIMRALRRTGLAEPRKILETVSNGAAVANGNPRREGNPYPEIEYSVSLIPAHKPGNKDLTIDEIYGPLFEKVQNWADGRDLTEPALSLFRIIDMPARKITFLSVQKSPDNPVSVYREEAAAFRRLFPGYVVEIRTLQGLGAAKGLIRYYNVIKAERDFLVLTNRDIEKPFISLGQSIEDAASLKARRARLSFDFGPFQFTVLARVPSTPLPTESEVLLDRLKIATATLEDKIISVPDEEFLFTFRPFEFLRAHRSNPLQQAARILGVACIWIGMVATPIAVSWMLPDDTVRVVTLVVGFLPILVATWLSRNPADRLARWQKLLLAPAYLPNILIHGLYNAVVWFAPLVTDEKTPDDAALRAWAGGNRNTKVKETQPEIETRFGVRYWQVYGVLKEFGITTSGQQPSAKRLDLEAWAFERRGKKITESAKKIAERTQIGQNQVTTILGLFEVKAAREKTPNRIKLDAWMSQHKGKIVMESWASIKARFHVRGKQVDESTAEHNVTLVNPQTDRIRKFRAWAKARENQTVPHTLTDLGTLFKVSRPVISAILDEFHITTTLKSAARLKMEAWAAERRDKLVPESMADLEITFELTTSIVADVLAEYNITPTAGVRNNPEARTAGDSLRGWAEQHRGETLTITAKDLASVHNVGRSVATRVAREHNIKLKRYVHNVGTVPVAPVEPVVVAPLSAEQAAKQAASIDRLRKWAAEREGEILVQKVSDVAMVYGLDLETVKGVLVEFRITEPAIKVKTVQESVTETDLDEEPKGKKKKAAKAPKPAKAPAQIKAPKTPKPAGPRQGIGDYLHQFQDKTISESPAQLAATFDLPERLVLATMASLNIKYKQEPPAGLVTPATRKAAGTGASEAWLRLAFAPDHEFLQTFRPLQFLRAHNGTGFQQVVRAIGITLIWLSMLAVPAVVAGFIPDAGVRVFILAAGYGMISMTTLLANINSAIKIPIEIKIALAPVYLPNVLVHALYNAVVWFAPLTVPSAWVPAQARATDEEVDRLVTEINAVSVAGGGIRAAADRLILMNSLLDALGVLPRRGEGTVINFLDGANRLIGLDRDTLGIDGRRTSWMDASFALSMLFKINDERPRLEGYKAIQADIEHTLIIQAALNGMTEPFVFYLHHVHYFFAWYKGYAQNAQISGQELSFILQDHIKRLKPPVIVTTEWTDLHYGNFYEQFLARLGYRKFLRQLLPGSHLDNPVEPATDDSRMYSVSPDYNIPTGGETEVYLHESVIPKTPRRAETEQERIDRELTGLKGVFYYPAGGADWKPFRYLLPRMPAVTKVISIDREYGNYHPEQPHYKENRARYLLQQEGFQVEPIGRLTPDHVFVRNATGQQWSATYIQGDVLSRDVRDNLPLNDANGRSKVAFLHVERPGEFAALTSGEYGPVFHARTISVVMPGGILGGYLRPADEPLEFMQDHYELLGLERLGKDSNGHIFLKKNAVIDETVMADIIRIDRRLLELYKRVEYPAVAFWTISTQSDLEETLVKLKAVSPAVHDAVVARFVVAFRKMNDLTPGTWKFSGERLVGPLEKAGDKPTTASVRFVLPALFITIALQSAELAPLLLALSLGAAVIELALTMPGNPLRKLHDWIFAAHQGSRSTTVPELDRRARVLVGAALTLSQTGSKISDSLIDDTLSHAARAEGVLSAGRAAAADPADWTTSLSDRGFTAALDRALARARASGMDPRTVRAVVDRLSGWGVPVNEGTIGTATIVVPVREPKDLRRVAEFEKRFPGAPILIWASAEMAAVLDSQNVSKWPVQVFGEDLFSNGRLLLRNVQENLPKDLRAGPQNILFALPADVTMDDTGLAISSEWRNLRVLFVDEILGTMRIMTAAQRNVLDRIVDHLVAATQA